LSIYLTEEEALNGNELNLAACACACAYRSTLYRERKLPRQHQPHPPPPQLLLRQSLKAAAPENGGEALSLAKRDSMTTLRWTQTRRFTEWTPPQRRLFALNWHSFAIEPSCSQRVTLARSLHIRAH